MTEDAVIEAMARAMARATDGAEYETAWEAMDDTYREVCRDGIRAALRAAEEAGWRLVPRRATNAMLDAVEDLVSYPEEVWTAMLAAAPKVGDQL